MKLIIKTARDFINPLLSRKSIDEDLFNQFKLSLESYKKSLSQQLATKQNESNIVTSTLVPFFNTLKHNAQPYSQKGQSGIDLAIIKDNKPAVIVEAKVPNSKDMINHNELNKKAFYEAIFYFMVERGKGNNALFHIIVTDFYNWFVFDAKDFDRLFWRNSIIKKIYTTYTDKNQLAVNTKDVYSALEKVLPSLMKDLLEPEELEAAHFNFKLDIKEKELVAIYKLLSADGLLKEFKANEANSLNENFYKELLYIIGLEEAKENGKKVIGQAKILQNGTLYENISNKLAQYQKPNDFESVIKHIIIWINRILFLKLLESQIGNWTNTKNDNYLHPNKLNQYDQLETLFFEVLAKPLNKRTVGEYNQVPYLNSSLFEIHPDEKAGITIATLADDLTIEYFSKTVLTENKQHKKGKVSTLPYLLEFLDAYNFANDSGDEITNNAKSLISASVLGLIFEKINGYKDGSFYTPSFITMYMARETITKAVIDKFNTAHGWQCKTLIDLHNKEPNIAEANALINSITICDPAVGSGHFLVSALNEILYIKSRVGVLVDDAGWRLTGYSFSIESDELIIKDDAGEIFEYKKGNETKTRLQKTLFKEKQAIIENCLFGVDINPNSVNICRLRLWIELLKNAYYKPDGLLDTLPNIDINIKCGNSLISRFGLTDNSNSKTIKTEIKAYKAKIADYKQNIGSKQEVLQVIDAIKTNIKEDLYKTIAPTLTRNEKLAQYVKQFGLDGLSKELAYKAFELNFRQQVEMFAKEVSAVVKNKLLENTNNAQTALLEIESGAIYQNAFEWRFEFPEVLNDDGGFIGFDLVIGNPPYFNIDAFGAGTQMLRYFPEHYSDIYMDKSDILFYFIALSNKISASQTAFIISNAMLFSVKAQKLRNVLLSSNPIRKIINFEKYQVFDEASITSMMLFLDKTHVEPSQVKNFSEANYDKALLVTEIEEDDNFINIQFSVDTAFALVNDSTAALNQKIDGNYLKLGDILHVGKGMETAANKVFSFDIYPSQFDSQFVKKRMDGEIIERFTHKPAQDYLLYIEPVAEFDDLPEAIRLHLNVNKIKLEERATVKNEGRIWWRYSRPMHKGHYHQSKIWCSYRAKNNTFCLDETNDFIGLTNTTVIFDTNPTEYSIKYVLALLNSKLLNYRYKSIGKQTGNGVFEYFENQVSQLPIPAIAPQAQEAFVTVTESIIKAKHNNQDTNQLEAKIDALVYQLYQLTPDEISVIEAAS